MPFDLRANLLGTGRRGIRRVLGGRLRNSTSRPLLAGPSASSEGLIIVVDGMATEFDWSDGATTNSKSDGSK